MSYKKATAQSAIAAVRGNLKGLPVFITGSAYAASKYSNISDTAFSDVDVFCATDHSLISAVQKLLSRGYTLDDRFQRIWQRWLRFGFNGWHTNSIKLEHKSIGIDVNLVYKLVGKHPTSSLSSVLESFDFGLLAVGGIDCLNNVERDMRSYLFPSNIHAADLDAGTLPFMPNKRMDWRQGFISEYSGLRMVGRYAKYHGYGYDMRYIKDDLLTGYGAAAAYLATRDDDPDKLTLSSIYKALRDSIDTDDFASLKEAGEELIMLDSLDQIYEKLQ